MVAAAVAGVAELFVCVEVEVAVVAVVVVEAAGVVPLDELSPDVVGGFSDALVDISDK